MAKKTLADLKAAYAKNSEPSGERAPSNFYPFWGMKTGESCTVRFVPDLNDDNPLSFMMEKLMHNLTINGEKKNVPCLKMYGDNCPICKTSAEFYKAEGDNSPNGKSYWRKKQYLAQCIVLKDPLPADETTGETHVGKIRFLNLSYQIYQVITEAFKSDELEEIPCDLESGYDFVIKKTQSGKYDAYNIGTKFTKQRALSEDEIELVNENAVDLTTLLPKNPGIDKVQSMLDAALTGGTYSEGSSKNSDDEEPVTSRATMVKAVAKAVKAPVASDDEEDDTPPFVPTKTTPAAKPAVKETKAVAGDADVDDMLHAIRARRAGAAAK